MTSTAHRSPSFATIFLCMRVCYWPFTIYINANWLLRKIFHILIITRAGILSISIFMRVDIKTKNSINKVTITNLDKELLFLISRIVKIGLIVFGIITSLGTFGINISAMVAGLGLTGFALGFALKDVVSNLIAGSIILLHRPFKLNDEISIVGHEGKVIKIDLRYTTIESDDKKILIPNSILFTKEIIIHN